MSKVTINDHIFRGYDLRGVSGVDLSEEVMELLGRAYATFLYQRRIWEVVVGRDNRTTSEAYSKAFIKGLLDSGIDVVDIGLSLAQIVYFAQYPLRFKGAVMITASHNPAEYNGIKMAVGFSDTMTGTEIQELKAIAKSGQFKKFNRKATYSQKDIFPEYKEDILRRIGEIGKFKVVVDTIYGTAGMFLPKILREAGCEVIEQHTELDGTFPLGTADPTERKVQERLAERVKKEKADIGFSYDTDGDRMGIVDKNGRIIWNDTLVSIFAMDVLDFMPGAKIIFNVLCSKQTRDVIEAHGGKPIIWMAGHSYIKAKLKEERAPFAGELSGHMFFADNFYGHDDEAYATLRLLAYLTRVGKSLDQVVDSLPKYHSSPEVKVGCPDNIKFKLVSEGITKDIKALYPTAFYVDIDGIRFDTDNEMGVVRASQNGPYLTVKYEAKDAEEYINLKKVLSKILHKYTEIDFKDGVNIDALE
ncbi:MAG: phosphomannomutase/phosphoglucomutase [Candidatus Daviesbacteria bacterium]|nr:phosphomannomutase/phosphoglucomutase [Candidatus Daviesbacteria bacterium]